MCLPRPESVSGRNFDDLMGMPANNGSEPEICPPDKDSCNLKCLNPNEHNIGCCCKFSEPMHLESNDSCLDAIVAESTFGSDGIPSVSSLKLENISDNFGVLDSESDSSSSLSEDAKNPGYCLRPRKLNF